MIRGNFLFIYFYELYPLDKELNFEEWFSKYYTKILYLNEEASNIFLNQI